MSATNHPSKAGFTIVELLIVIVVIGILATITVMAYSDIQERARVARANSDLETLSKSIQLARLNVNTTLMGVTGSNCTMCFTQSVYNLSLDRIGGAAGTNLTALKAGDPWGNNYQIDENEAEQIANPCVRDSLSISSAHSGLQVPSIPFYNCPG